MVFFFFMNYIYVNRGRHLYEHLATCLRKSTHQDYRYWYFSLSLTVFENINQEHKLPPNCAFLWTVYLCTRMYKYMSSFSAFVLATGNILFRSMPNGNCLFNSASLSLVGDKSLAHKFRVMAAVRLHLNATYAQHLTMKSVF